MIDFMESVETDFTSEFGLYTRDMYKIYYSHIHIFPLLILGQNPGGTIGKQYLSASTSYFENWEHDFVEFQNNNKYALAKPMCDLLHSVLQTNSDNIIRQIPFTNIIFRRSQNTEQLNTSLSKAVLETQPYLTKIIKYINPNNILFISKTAYDLFVKYYCKKGTICESQNKYVLTPNGRDNARIYSQGIGFVNCLDRNIRFYMVGHPSKYSSRKEWTLVTKYLLEEFITNNLSPMEKKEYLYTDIV